MFQGGITIVSAALLATSLVNNLLNFVPVVILRGSSNNSNFRGFLIQGRMREGSSPAGSFGSGTGYQSRCSGNVRLSVRLTVLAIL